MYTKESLIRNLEQLEVDRNGTLLVHSSYKSIGEVEGGPDTILDALTDYMKNGLLVMPTHTWSYIDENNPRFHVQDSPSCVGILTELFRKRPGVVRSLHPTHSVAALGKDAEAFVTGNEKCDTPCGPQSPWGKLLERKATIMLLGVDLRRNTFMHGIEEWANIPNRVADRPVLLYTILPDGTEIPVPSRRHSGGENWSDYFWKVNDIFIKKGVMYTGRFGLAEVRICDADRMTSLLNQMLRINPDLFSTIDPLDPALEYEGDRT
ncbi:AAC(3) family N-acetyltransferase [Paenibacillus beijingensis]|uniref:Aminoglycoside N(3)-acetyltransferase n=1 Tax=Paenibacillus beijingensis TaxID=1126833 RepID=A0A0D5NKW4_9BACL|nr:AAC(3) family N-acetyltransferase [Paenibacillus beijingensis]AJY75901.1 aminoglycoside 3-N-acetyltransferase [Paenibacillus beijingensis]